MKEVLDLYDNNFNKLNKTIIRRVDEIPENANIMMSYILIKHNDKYLLEQSTEKKVLNGQYQVVMFTQMKMENKV